MNAIATCVVCDGALYSLDELAGIDLCWTCAVAFDGGSRLRSTVTLPAHEHWTDCWIALAVLPTERAQLWEDEWDG
jgi:hypothetical protein